MTDVASLFADYSVYHALYKTHRIGEHLSLLAIT